MLDKAENSKSSSDGLTSKKELAKKYMCINPYEGFVCKRNGTHAGVAMPNFRTCYAILLVTANYLLTLHYPSRAYSQQLPNNLKKWQHSFKEKIEDAQIVLNKNYAAWGSSTENNINSFQAKLSADLKLKFTVVETAGLLQEDLLIINAETTAIITRSNDIAINPAIYANWPRQPASRLRYYSCRAKFFTNNCDFPVAIIASQKFFTLVDEKEWPACVNDHIKSISQNQQTAMQTISETLIEASKDKTAKQHAWAMAIGLEGTEICNNLKHYLYLLLALLHHVDVTVELQPLTKQVESIDTFLKNNKFSL